MKTFGFVLLVWILNTSCALAQVKGSIKEFIAAEKVLEELSSKLKNTNGDSERVFSIYNLTAQRFVKRGNYIEADSLFNEATKLIKFQPDSSVIVEMMISRSSMFKDQGKFNQSLKTLMAVLDYYQRHGDVNGQLWASAYLVEFYRYTSNADLSLKFIKAGEELIKANQNLALDAQAYLMCRKASYYTEFVNKDDSTKYHLEIALRLSEKLENKYIHALNQNEYGRLLIRMAPDEAENILYYLSAASKNMLADERYRNYSTVLQSIAIYYVRNGRAALALQPTLDAIELGEKNEWTGSLDDTYRLAGEVYYELGEYQQSASMMNMALSASYNRLKESHSIEVNELTASLEKNIAEQKLSELRIANQIAEERAIANKKALIGTGILLILSLITVIIIALFFHRIRNKNAMLKVQQETITKTNAKLKDAIDQKNVLYKELNHRVKNNLTILSGLVYLQESGEKSDKQKDLYKTLRERIQSMALVHQNLYEFNEALKINFQEYLRQLIPNIAATFSNGVKTSTEISCDNLIIEMEEAVPLAMIINEIITNSFKHAFSNGNFGKISLWSEIINGKRVIHYRDNGPGMPNDYEHINSQSLGMRLVKLMILQLKATLKYEGDKNGAYFTIELH